MSTDATPATPAPAPQKPLFTQKVANAYAAVTHQVMAEVPELVGAATIFLWSADLAALPTAGHIHVSGLGDELRMIEQLRHVLTSRIQGLAQHLNSMSQLHNQLTTAIQSKQAELASLQGAPAPPVLELVASSQGEI